MSTARVTLKFGEIPFEAFFAGAANVIFRHASTGVWVKEVREYASTRVREYASTRVREKSWWTLFGLTTKAGNSSALLGPSLDKFEKIRIKVGLVLVAMSEKTEYSD